MKNKIIIVGAGPAGISTAIKLKQNNIDCLLIEATKFPRNKTCGGGLTQKSIKLIENLLNKKIPENIINNKTNKFQLTNNNKILNSIILNNNFYLTDRINLDNWLINEYKNMGGNLLENTKVITINTKKSTIKCSNNKEFSYDILIGADGTNSTVRKYICQSNYKKALGIETLIPINDLNIKKDTIILDIGILNDGYLWIFPEKNFYNVGLATTYSKKGKLNYQSILKNYLAKNFNYNKNINIKGAFLPYDKCHNKYIKKIDNIFLIGDAYGLIDPLTGEGIYYALQSGLIMASSIIEAINNNTNISKIYNKKIKILTKQINRIYHLRKKFYKYRNTIINKIPQHTKFIKYYCDNEVHDNKDNYNILKIIWHYKRSK